MVTETTKPRVLSTKPLLHTYTRCCAQIENTYCLFRHRKLKKYGGKEALFGLNLILDGEPGKISVGDQIMG